MLSYPKIADTELHLFKPLCFYLHILSFNPRTGGGGVDFNPPVRFFADSEKTAARSAAKFAIAVQPTIWHISKKRRPTDPKGHVTRSD